VGIVRFAVAVDEDELPERVAVADVVPPASPADVTVTTVPVGMFDALSATATGFVVLLGSVTSGVEYEPLGDIGTDTPATDVILKLGVFGRVTTLG